jgi:hypothetical protein
MREKTLGLCREIPDNQPWDFSKLCSLQCVACMWKPPIFGSYRVFHWTMMICTAKHSPKFDPSIPDNAIIIIKRILMNALNRTQFDSVLPVGWSFEFEKVSKWTRLTFFSFFSNFTRYQLSKIVSNKLTSCNALSGKKPTTCIKQCNSLITNRRVWQNCQTTQWVHI